ncbi:dihydrolipoyl dehydrogenase [candidate division NPL-UPA2 bacterium]|nr:dihydrolipoyl dehydrogenase [candidate division NPL-UPA2 bacterium]
MSKIVVIGAGPGGYVAAIRAAQLGSEVMVIEKSELGGTCLNVGCIPTKALLASAELLSTINNASKFGITVGEVSPKLPEMMARKEKIVAGLRKGIEYLFKSRKIALLKGVGKILEPGKVEVVKGDGSKDEVSADRIIIATGSGPARPKIFPFDGEKVITSDEALSLKEVPESLLIVGAGAIGVEFACIFASLGTKVTVVEMLAQSIPTEDSEIARELEKSLKRRGIKIYTGTKIEKVEATGSAGTPKLKVESRLSSGEKIEVEKVLVAVGRKLNSEGLEEIGLRLDGGRVMANEKMETNIPNIYAIGDVAGGLLLAHKASAEGIVAAENASGHNSAMDYRVVPTCIFTSPEVASVGLTEKKAEEAGHKLKVGKFPFRALGKAHAIGEVDGLIKIIADASSDEILGVHIVGPHATDLIAEAALAMKTEVTAEELGSTIHAHPTLAEGLMEAAHAVHAVAIHSP